MGLMKNITATAIAAIAAVTMSITAFAGTGADVVQSAKDAGVPSNNVKELENFLEVHKDCFTSEQYDGMAADINSIKDKYITPKAKELFGKDAGDLTNDEKVQVTKNLTSEQKSGLVSDLVGIGKKYQVSITAEQIDDSHFKISAEHKHKVGSGKMAGGTTIKTDNPVAATGGNPVEKKTSSGTVAMAYAALTVSSACVLLAFKKNKA